MDSILKGGDPLPQLSLMQTADGRVTADFVSKTPVVKAQLLYTADTGPWPPRKWIATDAKIVGNQIQADLPKSRPLVYFLSVTDQRGAMTSPQHARLPYAAIDPEDYGIRDCL